MLTRCTLLALCLVAAPALGAESSRTAHYPVTGATAKDVYDSIRTTSPRVAPNATFAYTAIATKTDKKEATTATGCRYASFRTSAIYIFNLPQHAKPAQMAEPTKAKWNSFTKYLAEHEEIHRGYWRDCLADYDKAARALEGKSCEALDKKREKLFTKIKLACIAKDERLDFYFRKDVFKHPFVAEALAKDKKK